MEFVATADHYGEYESYIIEADDIDHAQEIVNDMQKKSGCYVELLENSELEED